jgi:hypothetical protein
MTFCLISMLLKYMLERSHWIEITSDEASPDSKLQAATLGKHEPKEALASSIGYCSLWSMS